MSEGMPIPLLTETVAKKVPTVYFIDDSATMREVIKIAFRRESITVIACADAASALAQFEQNRPDIVITDVIMPDQDGYSVCSQIKNHPEFGNTPVVLMSGVVNKSVADKAVSVHADELIRKPFQPQELIGRVKSLLEPKGHASHSSSSDQSNERLAAASNPATSLSSLFAPALTAGPAQPRISQAPPQNHEQKPPDSVWPRALAEAFVPRPSSPESQQNSFAPLTSQRPASPSGDTLKLRAEIARLDLLIKKLQTELQIERQYNQALEAQLQALTRID
jgi:twitching motility two-component system response regulator PilH